MLVAKAKWASPAKTPVAKGLGNNSFQPSWSFVAKTLAHLVVLVERHHGRDRGGHVAVEGEEDRRAPPPALLRSEVN